MCENNGCKGRPGEGKKEGGISASTTTMIPAGGFKAFFLEQSLERSPERFHDVSRKVTEAKGGKRSNWRWKSAGIAAQWEFPRDKQEVLVLKSGEEINKQTKTPTTKPKKNKTKNPKKTKTPPHRGRAGNFGEQTASR